MTLQSFIKKSIYLYALSAPLAFAHQGHSHHPKTAGAAETTSDADQSVVRAIQQDYNLSARHILEQKCMDCHGGTPRFPWYYKIPGVRQLLDHDVAESKEHLDFSKGYPFGGHGTPAEDLQAIQEAMNDGSMPPFRYRIMHPESTVQGADRDVIIGWTQRALKLLSSEKTEKHN